MSADDEIEFGDYRLHRIQGLTKGQREVRVTPKSLAVLHLLATRAGEVVTKDELFRTVWTGLVVSDATLASCVKELRQALRDDARRPKYIETLHRRGYRFVAATARADSASGAAAVPVGDAQPALVGREPALEQLEAALGRARDGVRQTVFVTGEPGIGKTALLETFAARAGTHGSVAIARADCVERYGAGEAYQPLLEALTRLCRPPAGAALLPMLRKYAPTWLAQLPALQTEAELRTLLRQTAGVTPQRMLRELNDALEAMTRTAPLVLWLEDLHWSDLSTLDWIAAFARRPERARLLLVATYRSGDELAASPALRSLADGLRMKGACTTIALEGLDENAVDEYVASRFPPGEDASLARLVRLVVRHTEGNPLFVVNVLNDLVARGLLVERGGRWSAGANVSAKSLGIPEDVRRLIEQQIDRLEPRQRQLLETASVLGGTCSAAAVAAGAKLDVDDVETVFGELAQRRRFIRAAAPTHWPDGTVAGSVEFSHALYREVLGERLAPARRKELHRRIGLRLEAAHGERAPEVAVELAVHFEQAGDLRRAVVYRNHAGDTDRRRTANPAAQVHFRRALELLAALPPSRDRDELEVTARMGLGGALLAASGFAAPDVKASYSRARELCQKLESTSHLFPALWGLWLYGLSSSVPSARELADTLQTLADQTDDSSLRLQAHHAQWATAFCEGRVEASVAHVAAGEALYDNERDSEHVRIYGDHDARVCGLTFGARAHVLAGRPQTAVRTSDAAIALAREIGHPFTLALALGFAAFVHQTRRDAALTRERAVAATAVARAHGFALPLAWGTALEGWSLTQLGDPDTGLALLHEGVAAARGSGSELFVASLVALLAETQCALGLAADAASNLEEAAARVERVGDRVMFAELHRLRGELRLAAGSATARDDAQRDFAAAVEVADSQGTKLLALRSAVALARSSHGRERASALRRLAVARTAVTEGGIPEVGDADALLGETAE